MRLYNEGAEAGDNLFWDLPGTVVNTTTNARISGRCFQFNANNASYPKNFAATSEFYKRFVFMHTNAAGTLTLGWYNGTTLLGSISRDPTTGFINISCNANTVTGTVVTSINTHYVIELHVKIADAGGVVEFKIDGVLQPGFSGDTKPGAATTADNIKFSVTTGGVDFVDDMALNDVSGGADNSWCGDAHYYALTLNGNGDSSNLTGSDGNSTDNYLLADEVPSNGDTDYVESATSGHKDLYNLTSIPSLPSGSAVKRVIVESRARELTADANAINLGVKGGTGSGAPSTESWSGNITVGISYARQVAEFTTNPATSAAWTEAEINAMQAGVKIV